MISDKITPRVRIESFLDDIAGGSNNLVPKTRAEYYLKKIAEKDSSSLPACSAGDSSKVLTVVPVTTEETVVPEQTVVVTEDDVDGVALSNTLLGDLTNGASIQLTVGNDTFTGTWVIEIESNPGVQGLGDNPYYDLFVEDGVAYFYPYDENENLLTGSYTVSAVATTESETQVEPQWKAPSAPSGGGMVIHQTVTTQGTYNYYTLDKTYAEIKTALYGGIVPVLESVRLGDTAYLTLTFIGISSDGRTVVFNADTGCPYIADDDSDYPVYTEEGLG